MATYTIEPDDQTLHGFFSPDLAPVLTIDSGDTIRFRTLDADWGLEPFTTFVPPGPPPRRRATTTVVGPMGHAALWSYRHPRRAAGDDPRDPHRCPPTWSLGLDLGRWRPGGRRSAASLGIGCGCVARSQPIRPPGHAPPVYGRHGYAACRTWAARNGAAAGDRRQSRLQRAGRRQHAYLPIAVPGGLFSVGDGHALQGDGEVSRTAIECPMDQVTLTFVVRDDLHLTTPRAETPAGWLTFGFADDLDGAARIALDAMLTLLATQYGVARVDALALASLVVDLRVTQMVNQGRASTPCYRHGRSRSCHCRRRTAQAPRARHHNDRGDAACRPPRRHERGPTRACSRRLAASLKLPQRHCLLCSFCSRWATRFGIFCGAILRCIYGMIWLIRPTNNSSTQALATAPAVG